MEARTGRGECFAAYLRRQRRGRGARRLGVVLGVANKGCLGGTLRRQRWVPSVRRLGALAASAVRGALAAGARRTGKACTAARGGRCEDGGESPGKPGAAMKAACCTLPGGQPSGDSSDGVRAGD